MPHSIDDGPVAVSAQIPRVPEICRFYGIVIQMLQNRDSRSFASLRMTVKEHAPPHFHAVYGEHEVSVAIRDGAITGYFPPSARRLVLNWRQLHERELMANWELLRAGQPARPIAPFDERLQALGDTKALLSTIPRRSFSRA